MPIIKIKHVHIHLPKPAKRDPALASALVKASLKRAKEKQADKPQQPADQPQAHRPFQTVQKPCGLGDTEPRVVKLPPELSAVVAAVLAKEIQGKAI